MHGMTTRADDDRWIARARDALGRPRSPFHELPHRLVAVHVAVAVEQRALLAVWIQDWRSLPQSDRQRIRRRQGEYVGIWVQALVRLRPDLGPAEAETVVHAALGAVNSVAFHDAGLPDQALEGLIVGLATAVLRAG